MEIIVLVKQVPDTTEVKVDPKTGTLIRDGVPSILNPFDQFALEEALRFREKNKDKIQVNVTVISMGPPQAKSAIMKCLALGADKGILLSDRAFAGADTWATSLTLAEAIKKCGKFDIVFCGQQAIDGDTAQVGPEVAQHLGIPQVTYVDSIQGFENGKLTVKSLTDEGYRIVETKLPVLLTCSTPSSFEPTNPSMAAILKANKKPFEIWTAETLGGDKSRFGLSGSPTQVSRVYSPEARGKGVVFKENVEDAVKKVVEGLIEKKVI
ncbi:MAG: electron transfer flavoprotein subunit beta/FixA family protein [Thermoplasmata archaeon]